MWHRVRQGRDNFWNLGSKIFFSVLWLGTGIKRKLGVLFWRYEVQVKNEQKIFNRQSFPGRRRGQGTLTTVAQTHFLWQTTELKGLPGSLGGKESACQCRRHRRHGFDSRVGKIPWSSKWQRAPEFLPGKFHKQRTLAGDSQSVGSQRVRHSRVAEHTPIELKAFIWQISNTHLHILTKYIHIYVKHFIKYYLYSYDVLWYLLFYLINSGHKPFITGSRHAVWKTRFCLIHQLFFLSSLCSLTPGEASLLQAREIPTPLLLFHPLPCSTFPCIGLAKMFISIGRYGKTWKLFRKSNTRAHALLFFNTVKFHLCILLWLCWSFVAVQIFLSLWQAGAAL